jgi:hypothetical protein
MAIGGKCEMNVGERRGFEIWKVYGTDIKVSGSAGPESPLDVSSTIRGEVTIAFSAYFRRY